MGKTPTPSKTRSRISDEALAHKLTNVLFEVDNMPAIMRAVRILHPDWFADPQQVQAATANHECDEVEVDACALLSDPEDGTGYWVGAWVWVSTDQLDAAED